MNSPAPAARARGAAPFGWAAALPLLCTAHCLAAPLVAVAAPAMAFSEVLEHAVQAASVVLAAAMAWAGVRAHGRWAVLAPMAAGVVAWIVADALALPESSARVAHVGGGLLLAAGMLWNGRLRHQAACNSCGCPAHHD